MNLKIGSAVKAIAILIGLVLGADVVMEAVGTDNEHLHVEWDP